MFPKIYILCHAHWYVFNVPVFGDVAHFGVMNLIIRKLLEGPRMLTRPESLERAESSKL